MPNYKLYYFDARGLAETTRQLFALAGQPFEDIRYSVEEWPHHVHEMPFGRMPVLEVDGRKLPESWAIARYVAKEFGFAGQNNFECALVDAFGDLFKDYFNELQPLHGVQLGLMRGVQEKLVAEVAEPARNKFFTLLQKQLKENKTGFLVGASVSWIDLTLAEHVTLLLGLMPDFLDAFPTVLAHRDKVQALPKIRDWLTKRPEVTPLCRDCIHPATALEPHHPLLSQQVEMKGMEEQLREPPARCHRPSPFTPPTEGQTM